MSVEVVTVMNRIPDPVRESYYKPHVFFKSLERFGVKPTVLGLNEEWGGLMTKPRRLRQWLREGKATAETLIVCDAFDIVFVAPPDEVAEEYRRGWPGPPIVFNAEKGIFPRAELAHRFDDVPGPWKYLNSGFMIGAPERILAMLEAMWLDEIADDHPCKDELHYTPCKEEPSWRAGLNNNPNDQGLYQLMYSAQVVPMALDHQARLCQALSGCELSEFDITDERIKNVLTQSTPLVFHFNGSSKNDLMPIFLKHWGLE